MKDIFNKLKLKANQTFHATDDFWARNKNDIKSHADKLVSDGKNILDKGSEQAATVGKAVLDKTSDYIESHDLKNKTSVAADVGSEYIKETASSASDTVTGIYHDFRYSEADINKLKARIENQGGFYREINKNKDTIMIGGESLINLLSAGAIPESIINAYESAYPDLSQTISFADKVREIDGVGLTGFISGVKGKLFEQKYVEYLNNGNLPDGYTAVLAGAANQPGWDIAIEGGNGEIASVLQAKATDSVSYVKEAIERYPNIDVVTTDEVYSHLVMTGISDNITNSNITNDALIDVLEDSVDASELAMDFTPPLFTLAFIAFTSYKDESLTLYEKAKNAGDRSGKTYLSYIIGGGVAAITNTWWIGVIGTVGSSLLSDKGKQKQELYEKLKDVEKTNQNVINLLKT